jgi:hypothetical protein
LLDEEFAGQRCLAWQLRRSPVRVGESPVASQAFHLPAAIRHAVSAFGSIQERFHFNVVDHSGIVAAAHER